MPFGVELPAHLQEGNSGTTPDSSGAPSGAPSDSAPSGAQPVSSEGAPSSQAPGKADTLPDLDKLERFRFEGREWKKEELRRAYLRNEDYTRKTQELAETRKYADNFAHDLRVVVSDPSRLEDMRRIYPREFVERAEEILKLRGGLDSKKPSEPQPANDPVKAELEAIRREREADRRDIEAWKETQRQSQIEHLQAWVNQQHETLSKKYEWAATVPQLVEMRAEVAANQGVKITAEVMEKIYKAVDGEIRAKWDEKYKGKVTRQTTVNREAKDVGPGGGAPIEGPKKFSTIKDATADWLKRLNANG
jgi:hypothetical protein